MKWLCDHEQEDIGLAWKVLGRLDIVRVANVGHTVVLIA
jgi:hypothetical protein